jgi:two-component system, OmpR family, heavy metal sensor histidine kinase CusS
MKRISLTNRLTFLFACTSAAMLLGLGLLISNLVERHFEELDSEVLAGKLELAQSTLAKVQKRADMGTVAQQLNQALIGHSGLALVVRWPDKTTLFASSGADFPRMLLERSSVQDAMRPVLAKSEDGKPYLRIAASVPMGLTGVPPAIVEVALDSSYHQHFISTFQNALWVIVILAAILSGFLGRMAVRRGLAPLTAIKQEASAITANRLHQRLAVESVPLELEELVQTLNTMLGRLEESFQRLSDFSSDLAHELRTPVSNMLMQTQVTLTKTRSADEYREILYSNEEEFNRLSRMISDMLFLAKADHGLVAPFNDVIDLEQEVCDLFSFFEVLAEGKNVALRLVGKGSVTGDRTLMRRAISNVLSNAIRHTHATKRVDVIINLLNSGDLSVRIENTGDPIAPEHIPRLFDRFYRVDASRHDSSEGAGLGLAIAKSILALHGGSIHVESGGSMTCFELRLPSTRHCS